MTQRTRKLLLAFATLGLGAATTSSYVHYQLLTRPGYSSFCDVNATVTCAQVYMSQYGSVWGVPVALGGVVFFALVLVMAGVAGRSTSPVRDTAAAYIFALSTLGLAAILYLAWAAFFVLNAFCILCVITYVAVIAIFLTSGGATSIPMTTLPGRAWRDVRTLVSSPLALGVALLMIGGAATVIAAFPRDTTHAAGGAQAYAELPPVSDADRAKIAQWWDLQPKVDVPVAAGAAKVVVVKFNDYQCGACKVTHDAYKDLLAKHALTGQVTYEVKHFPLEPECNAAAPGGNHYASCEAAAAVVMAQATGKAAAMEEWIFARLGPPPLTGAQIREAARTVGGITDYDARYAGVLDEIRNDAALGNRLGVNSTPTFFINGRRLPPQLMQPQYFNLLLELELAR